MPQFDAFYVQRGGTQPLGLVHYFIGRHEEKFSVFVHELPDEPRAGHAIYFNSFSSNPFHGLSAPIICLIVVNSRRLVRRTLTSAPGWPRAPPSAHSL